MIDQAIAHMIRWKDADAEIEFPAVVSFSSPLLFKNDVHYWVELDTSLE